LNTSNVLMLIGQFDMRNDEAAYEPIDYINVILASPGVRLIHTGNHPSAAGVWERVHAPLVHAVWTKADGSPVTQLEFAGVLGDLDALYLYADWGWADTSTLDNVVLAVPEPASVSLSLLTLGGLAVLRRRK
jgi:hypothetical protein